jgi:hypothetical protein
MSCASIKGEKKKRFTVGNNKQPRCFERVKALLGDNTANKNTWVT